MSCCQIDQCSRRNRHFLLTNKGAHSYYGNMAASDRAFMSLFKQPTEPNKIPCPHCPQRFEAKNYLAKRGGEEGKEAFYDPGERSEPEAKNDP